MWNNN